MEVMTCNSPVFGAQDDEKAPTAFPLKRRGCKDGACAEQYALEQIMDNRARAARRARAAVRSYGYANADVWTYFVTLTIAPGSVVDRYNSTSVLRCQQQWLSNQVKRHGLIYVLVPERHKDGAIHFHGFFNDTLKMVDSGTVMLPGHSKPVRPRNAQQRAAGKTVFNIPAWKYGFSTAIPLDGDKVKAVSYICKYIGKQTEDGYLDDKIGGRWYYSGGDLRRPEEVYSNVSWDNCNEMDDGADYAFDVVGRHFAVRTVPLSQTTQTFDF